MKTLKEALEICTQMDVDPEKIKISKVESPKLEKQVNDEAIKKMRNKKRT